MRFRRFDAVYVWVMFVACGCFLSACAQTGSPEGDLNTTAAEILWLPAAASLEEDAARPALIKNGRSIYIGGSGAVVFSIVADCDDVARNISEHFEHTEWQPRARQDLNPQLATSFGIGCLP